MKSKLTGSITIFNLLAVQISPSEKAVQRSQSEPNWVAYMTFNSSAALFVVSNTLKLRYRANGMSKRKPIKDEKLLNFDFLAHCGEIVIALEPILDLMAMREII